ncbi:nucleoside triphosphate pyrophosphatase [Rhodoferax sp. PAMC 29310]|uniref:Maf family protein n=1 Tax=Rhodoferax sp. PAMC 29310 TaxID=2822760 RepID=UPI001B32FBF8|nr:Maf family protein [Rhodoferax sp. PAMC 29310]
MSSFIYLASQSPRRRQLLEQLGISFELLLAGPTEDAEALEAEFDSESPIDYVQRVTELKLDAALQRQADRALRDAPVLCSDTTVAMGSKIFGKPADAGDAVHMLSKLSGQTHRVLTAVALGTCSRRVQALSESLVTFAEMSRSEIESYVATGEPMGKAGAYAIQGVAAKFIARMEGSYSGIVGLPMFETARLLRSFDFKV